MHTIVYIAYHELCRLFKSPLAWLSMAVVQFFGAIFFYTLLSHYVNKTLGQLQQKGITQLVVANSLYLFAMLLLLLTPLLTMRLLSEERQQGTIKLLLSSPISLTQLVLGKYMAITCFYLILIAMLTLMPLSLLFGTQLDLAQLGAGLLGLLLLIASFAAIGLFISTLSATPSTAAIMSFAVLFMLWLIDIAGNTASAKMAVLFSYLSIFKHCSSLFDGRFSSVDILYYLLTSCFFIIISIWRLETERLYG